MLKPWLLIAFAALALAHQHDDSSEEIAEPAEPRHIAARQGDICNVEQGLKEAEFDHQFFECVVPTTDTAAWAWPQLGIWALRNCSSGYLFSALLGACKNESTVRRQQACGWGGCGQSLVVQPQPQPWYQTNCGPGGCGTPNIQIQQPYPEPVWPQPQPVQPIWPQPQPVQPIWPQPQPVWPQTQCPQQQVAVGSCNAQQQCPGPSVCQRPTNTCCQPPPPPPPPMPVWPQTQCPQQQVPVGSCDAQQQCPGPSVCQRPTNTCCQSPQPPPPPMPVGCGIPGPQPCPTPCGQPQCPQRVVARPCPQASGGCAGGQQGCGQYCSWMLESLKPGNGKGYMQCVPTPNPVSEYCGQWRPRKCGYGTMFNPRAQVCVRDPSVRPRPGPQCPQQQVPIGQCNAQQQCPGYSVCQRPTNTCCQQNQWTG